MNERPANLRVMPGPDIGPGAKCKHPATGRHPRMCRHSRDYAAPFAVLILVYAGLFKGSPLLSSGYR